MGIAPYIAEAIVREHVHRPLHGDVILLGRQTMMFTPDHAIRMIRAAGTSPIALPADEDIVDRTTDLARGHDWIRDDAFLRMLGATRVRAIDHTAYEGADVVHDLNQAIPPELEACADFIVDGSTLDNVFNPATCLQNIARMLRPAGRLISVNVGSPHQGPYTVMTPYWLLDFFAINDFADCRVYMTLHGRRGELSVFAVDAADEAGPPFLAPRQIGIVLFAEKGPQSTWDRYPVQRIYCDAAMMSRYRASATRFRSERPP
jgi:SAM-dependent methyltransferase